MSFEELVRCDLCNSILTDQVRIEIKDLHMTIYDHKNSGIACVNVDNTHSKILHFCNTNCLHGYLENAISFNIEIGDLDTSVLLNRKEREGDPRV